jgi:hypothetical protein
LAVQQEVDMSRRAVSFLALVLSLSAVAATVVVTIPAGTAIHFKLAQAINTATAKPGQSVPAVLTAPIVVDGHTIAAAGSRATLRISEAEASGRMGGSAKVVFHVSSITLANGSRLDVRSTSYSRVGKGHAKHNATYIATAGVLGALAGQAVGGNSKSTAKGAAIGAGVGVGAAAATGKLDFVLPAGDRYELKLKSPVKTTI